MHTIILQLIKLQHQQDSSETVKKSAYSKICKMSTLSKKLFVER